MQEINPWTIVDSRKIYDNNWIGLTEHEVINPSGGKGIYGEVHFKNHAIGILPLDNEMNTWLIGQYRFPLKAYSWEIPEGGGSLDLPPLDGAKRELLEETGYHFDNMEPLCTIYANPSTANNKTFCFIATGGVKVQEQELDDHEELIIEEYTIDQVKQLLADNKIAQALHCTALFYALGKMGKL